MLAAAVREQIRALDRNLPAKVSAFSELVDENLVHERLIATLSGFFRALALLLASVGLYGVMMAYNVQRRRAKSASASLLGADRGTVPWMAMRDCLVMVAAGIVIGIPSSLWLSKLVVHQLFGITQEAGRPSPLPTLLLTAVAALAGYLPARRASRVDPLIALRYE